MALSVKRTAAVTAVAVTAALAPMPAAWVDRGYSSALYGWIQPRLTGASNHVPFALFDAAAVLIVALWIAAALRDLRRSGAARAALAMLLRTVSWAATAYLVFLVLWGLNYRRLPLARKLPFDRTAVTPEAARRVARVTVDRLNALAVDAHRIGWSAPTDIDSALHVALGRATGDVGIAAPAVSRPKHTLLDWYFRRAGVDGMTDPYFLETLVVSDLLPFERPLVVAHEWSHLAGLADEAEANFLGWLACIHGSLPDQYSGWLFLYEELSAALPRADRESIAAALGGTPRADLAASRARALRNVQPRLSAAAWRAYDSYLKSNRVSAGTRSYGEVVQLVLGTRFDETWTPVRR